MKTLASLFVLLLAAPLYAQTGTVKIDNLPVTYGQNLKVSVTLADARAFSDRDKVFVRVCAVQNGTMVYRSDQFVKTNGTCSLSFPLVQQASYTAVDIYWDATKSATGSVQLIHFHQNGQRITTTILSGPIQFSIGAK